MPDGRIDSAAGCIALNSEGFRDAELPAAKPPGTFRIVCLGDSWTFGANVGLEDAYPRQLAARLRERFPDATFEVLNLGVLGYTSFQGLELLRQQALALEPDLVILGYGMNDGNVAGYRDRDMVGPDADPALSLERFGSWLERSNMFRLVRYWQDVRNWRPPTLGGAILDAVEASADAERQTFDYRSMEQWTRVSLDDYESHLHEMIRLIRARGADVILMFNEVWTENPYRDVAARVASDTGVGFVDGVSLIQAEQRRIEQQVERASGLAPLAELPEAADPVDVIFRLKLNGNDSGRGAYIVGADPQLGSLRPNTIAMYDDGTHGDQREGDGIWSFTAAFHRGAKVFYVYTTSGEPGNWTGLDVPYVRRFTVDAPNSGRYLYRPIETFGRVYMQADPWHTNAAGYRILANAIASLPGYFER